MKKTDIIVIGAGPAGLSAAIKASSLGAKVTVIDENPIAGGKLLGQLHEEPKHGWWIGKQIASDMINKALNLGVTVMNQTEVWGVYPQWRVQTNKYGEIQAPYLLLATGAAERAIPIPGWTLPGVMAIGAAQLMTNYYRVKPGSKVLVVGVDVLSLTVAREMKMAGAEVVGIVLSPPTDLSQEKSHPAEMIGYLSRLAHLAPSPLLRFTGSLVFNESMQRLGATLFPKQGMKVWDIPLLLRKAAVEIEGENGVQKVKLAQLTPDGKIINHSYEEIEVDAVCLSGGLYPLAELAATVGCEFTYLPELGGHVPIHSSLLETTKPGVYVAGNITGIEGAKVAMAQGELAGTVIASQLGLLGNESEEMIKRAKKHVLQVRDASSIQFLKEIGKGRKKMDEIWRQLNLIQV
ncbi:NAD(P)/FAD-dependent oxidoreductase [Ammoniphilus sp. CFH 90114]|uniref:NAD(P)/FAD-dependent oxidoreductase n=1 Tax=Ammoniphilus sp. CFH 90114 TaxID=2493665 RepID=UPI00100ECA7A|nr:FAD-dependent oxidoreductase [Ammoniphilus sp. CFH 90114]RXT06505.1 FAD-dependent oxidoreductase [Ammoniphilus sp. CFH 90114]